MAAQASITLIPKNRLLYHVRDLGLRVECVVPDRGKFLRPEAYLGSSHAAVRRVTKITGRQASNNRGGPARPHIVRSESTGGYLRACRQRAQPKYPQRYRSPHFFTSSLPLHALRRSTERLALVRYR